MSATSKFKPGWRGRLKKLTGYRLRSDWRELLDAEIEQLRVEIRDDRRKRRRGKKK